VVKFQHASTYLGHIHLDEVLVYDYVTWQQPRDQLSLSL
jgi:hypothetical protein